MEEDDVGTRLNIISGGVHKDDVVAVATDANGATAAAAALKAGALVGMLAAQIVGVDRQLDVVVEVVRSSLLH
jgi:hypothetical protein